MSAENYDVIKHRHAVSHRLVEPLPVGRGENHLVIITFGFKCGDTTVDWLNLHHHPGLPAERIIIHLPVLVGSVVTQIMHMELHQPLFLCPLQNRASQRGLEHFWKYGYDVDTHCCLLLRGCEVCLKFIQNRSISPVCGPGAAAAKQYNPGKGCPPANALQQRRHPI